jgi:hypothetical protein
MARTDVLFVLQIDTGEPVLWPWNVRLSTR